MALAGGTTKVHRFLAIAVVLIALFTAGDKEFYSHARALRKETGIKLVIFSTGNMIEDTPYKTGLCGILEDDHGMTLTGMSLRNLSAARKNSIGLTTHLSPLSWGRSIFQ